MRCPVCHKWFDCRDLRDAFEHMHDEAGTKDHPRRDEGIGRA
jgi:hypothetical protein